MEITYPIFVACTPGEWAQWNELATQLMISKYGDRGGNNYSSPFTDAGGQRYFIAYQEIGEVVPAQRLVDLPHDQIDWPAPTVPNTNPEEPTEPINP